MIRPYLVLCSAAGVVGAFVLSSWTHASRTSASAPPAVDGQVSVLHVPHAKGQIVLDGDMDDPGWADSIGRTGAFTTGDGSAARPYSDARFVWGDDHLFIALYAADEDIRSTYSEPDSPLWLDDEFHLTFRTEDVERSFEVSPTGVLTDAIRERGPFDYTWQSGAHVSYEIDGTLDIHDDDDEEWVIEMAIPFDALGLNGERGEHTGLSIRRCDTPHKGARVCATWGDGPGFGMLVLD